MSLWRRWWFRILCLIALAIAGIAFNVYWQRSEAEAELRQMLAALDEAEPDWRLEQIEAKRREVPDEENGALIVIAAHRALPKDWTSKPLDELDSLAPPLQLPDEIAQQLRVELARAEHAVGEARKLIDYPHGRYSIQYTPDFITTLVKEQQGVRTIGALLFLDANAQTHDFRPEKAWRSARALLNVGRSLGDEPLLNTVFTRVAMQVRSISCLERILGHVTVSDGELATMQSALGDEAAENLFLTGMRGERGGTHQLMNHLENSDTPIAVAIEGFSTIRMPPATWWDDVNDLNARKMAFRSHAWLVRYHTQVVNAAQMPSVDRYTALQGLDESSRKFFDNHALPESSRDIRLHPNNDYILAALLAPAFVKVAEAERRLDTHLHCTIAALAAERFRMKHERWPKSLDELIQAKLLKEAPIDLYVGKPIQLRRAPDGIVLYSVGEDGTYEGDALDRLEDFGWIGLRIEFRLWDPAKRRQSPLPPRKPADDQ